jgi:hypothetical protein
LISRQGSIDVGGQTVVLVSTMGIDDGDRDNGSTITTKIDDRDQSVSRILPKISLLQSKQHTEPLAHIGNDVGRSLRLERDSPRLPVQVLNVIGEDDP